MEYIIYGGVLLLSFVVSYITVPWAIKFANKKPNEIPNNIGYIKLENIFVPVQTLKIISKYTITIGNK